MATDGMYLSIFYVMVDGRRRRRSSSSDVDFGSISRHFRTTFLPAIFFPFPPFLPCLSVVVVAKLLENGDHEQFLMATDVPVLYNYLIYVRLIMSYSTMRWRTEQRREFP